MKRNYFAVILISALLFSCTGKVQRLEEENQLLAEEKHAQDSMLNEFMNAFNAFEENLDEIKTRENLISVQSDDPEMRLDTREQINQDLDMISSLLEQNRQIIDDLDKKLKKSQSQSKQFNRMVANLKKKLVEKDANITELTTQLEEKNLLLDDLKTQVADLNTKADELVATTEEQRASLDEQALKIEEQTKDITTKQEKLNTAYFVTGTSKELKEKNVIVRSKQVNADFTRDAFTPIDITKTFAIPVSSKRARLLTHHPAGSYVFTDKDNDKKLDQLEITDPENFWRTSKYLVVVMN